MNTHWRWLLRLGIACCSVLGTTVALSSAFSVNSTLAQEIKPIADDSLGAENSKVIPINPEIDRIDGGAIRGTNLFHSFSQFNIGEGREAHFTNPSGIVNILSRVTGSGASQIFGKLGVLGNANLFLINPNGVIFGPNAQLNIGGSFLASTASSIKLADGTEFSATAPQTTPLLTVSVPIGLQFGGTTAGVHVQGSNLEVQPGKTLALVGGDVTLQGGEMGALEIANLAASGGRIELGSVAGNGEVSLNQRGNGWELRYDRVSTFSNIQLQDKAFVNASGSGGGDIQIRAAQLDLSQKSYIFADTLGSGTGGEVLIHTAEAIVLKDGSLITADVVGSGIGANLKIETEKLTVQDRSRIATRTFGGGQGGNLSIGASKSIELIGILLGSQISSEVIWNPFIPNSDTGGLFTGTFGAGDAGNLTITTEKLTVLDGAAVVTGTQGEGRGGNLTVNASDLVEVKGLGFLSTETRDAGAAGNLTIKTRNLLLRDRASVSSETGYGSADNNGQGGKLEVTATDSVKLINLGMLSTMSAWNGNAGPLTISTGKLLVQNASAVTTRSAGEGLGGNLSVNARESVEVSDEPGFDISTLVSSTSNTGDAGDITISTGKLTIQNGTSIRTQTFGDGRAGNLNVTAKDFVELIGISAKYGEPGGLFTSNSTRGGNEDPRGDAGNITISTPKLIVRDGAQVTIGSEGTSSNAGNLLIYAPSIYLDNQAKLTGETAFGKGGSITLQDLNLLSMRRGSKISTTAGTQEQGGDGGNITINAPNGFIVTVQNENSDITANAFNGNGGRITINATGIFSITSRSRQDLVKLLQTNDPNQLDPASLLTNDISAISQGNPSLNGVVTINTPDIDPNRGLVELPTNLVDASQQIATGCNARDRQTSSFVATGRSGLPLSPSDPLRTSAVITQWVMPFKQTLSRENEKIKPASLSKQPDNNQQPTVEAQGWVVDKGGDIYLVAQNPNSVSEEAAQISIECHPS